MSKAKRKKTLHPVFGKSHPVFGKSNPPGENIFVKLKDIALDVYSLLGRGCFVVEAIEMPWYWPLETLNILNNKELNSKESALMQIMMEYNPEKEYIVLKPFFPRFQLTIFSLSDDSMEIMMTSKKSALNAALVVANNTSLVGHCTLERWKRYSKNWEKILYKEWLYSWEVYNWLFSIVKHRFICLEILKALAESLIEDDEHDWTVSLSQFGANTSARVGVNAETFTLWFTESLHGYLIDIDCPTTFEQWKNSK